MNHGHKKTTHNKLIRDKIPEIIKETGAECELTILSESDYVSALSQKLREETDEFLLAKNDDEWLEELADVWEVLKHLLKAKGISFSELEKKREEKFHLRGGFEKRLFLKSVVPNSSNA